MLWSAVNFGSGTAILCCRKTNTSGTIPTMEYIIESWYDFRLPKWQGALYSHGSTIAVFQLFLTSKFRYVDPFCVGIWGSILVISASTTMTTDKMTKGRAEPDSNTYGGYNTSRWDSFRLNWRSYWLVRSFSWRFKLGSAHKKVHYATRPIMSRPTLLSRVHHTFICPHLFAGPLKIPGSQAPQDLATAA